MSRDHGTIEPTRSIPVIASAAKQSIVPQTGLLRRYAPRNDGENRNDEKRKTAAGIAADGPLLLNKNANAYFGYLNSGAAFSASLVVFIEASHLSFLLS